MTNEITLSDWIGRTEHHEEEISPVAVNMMGAAVAEGWDAEEATPGALLPPLWHWAGFHQSTPLSGLGTDGHPALGGFLPPVPLERRMWAGGRLTFHAPLHVGERLSRRSTIRRVSEKQGGSGAMVFVTVAHEIHGAHGLAIEEEQDIVYIAIPPEFTPPKKIPAPDSPAFDERLEMSTVRLFRFSAATFNGHRIHFDRDYARDTEKYPGLVVHAPMQAILLMGAAIRHRGTAPTSFSFRGVHPMFDTHDLRLIGSASEDGMALCTAAPDGYQGLQAQAAWS